MKAPRALTEAVLVFGRLLRTSGIPVPISAAMDAVRALEVVDLTDRHDVFLAFRATLTGRREEWPVFERCFEAYWKSEPEPLEEFEEILEGAEGEGKPEQDGLPTQTRRNDATFGAPDAADISARSSCEPSEIPGLSDEETLLHRDFSSFDAEQLEELARLTAIIAMRLARRVSRRRKRPGRRGAIDLRRSVRANLTKGEIIELRRRQRRRKLSLVMLCDVSGSMDRYSRFLLQFVYALQSAFRSVETFMFSMRLVRISPMLRERSYKNTLTRLADMADWSGGTRIGESFREFNRSWGHLMDRRAILVILSDGWDTGDPQILAEEMRQFKRRVGRIIWLNPLLGTASYEPLTRGMAAALDYVDVFSAAHNLASLRELTGRLTLPGR